MREEMNIDFIKWMCEKAGWGFHFKCKNPCIAINGSLWSSPSSNDWKYRYPLLLQRAIESVNKAKLIRDIWMDKTGVYVTDNEFRSQSEYYDFNYYSIDQAKELALKYIYEQANK